MKTKKCTKCGEVKPVDCFGKAKAAKDGLNGPCKPCKAEQKRKWRKANPEKVAEHQRKWQKANKEKVAEYNRKWQKANKEEVAEQQRKYYEANKEKVAEQKRKYYIANRDRFSAHGLMYREANKEKVAEQQRKWYNDNLCRVKANNIRNRAGSANAAGTCTAEQLKARFDYYGNKCYNCGSDENLHADHRIPLSRGGSNHPANLIPLCQSCNCSKHTKTETEFKSQTQQETH